MEIKATIKRNDGITVVTLVVTIIIILILAGVSLSMLFDSEGLFKKASGTSTKYNEAKARETLETILMGYASTEKYTNPKYNQDDYLDDIILTQIENSKVQGDIAIVDGYAYELDRSVPKIGKYLGREEKLKFPEVSVDITSLKTDDGTIKFIITAKEEENGISKIEILLNGQVVERFTYGNVKDTITEECYIKRDGTYIVKAYSKLIGTARKKVEGIVRAVEFSINGDTTYKKEHSTQITVREDIDKVKKIKYQWLTDAKEPNEDSFESAEECTNNSTITGEGITGTYYLWILLETESGKKSICGSEAFYFDNEKPTMSNIKLNYVDLEDGKTQLTISLDNVKDTVSGLKDDSVKLYITPENDSKIEQKLLISGDSAIYTLPNIRDFGNCLIEVIAEDLCGNFNKISKDAGQIDIIKNGKLVLGTVKTAGEWAYLNQKENVVNFHLANYGRWSAFSGFTIPKPKSNAKFFINISNTYTEGNGGEAVCFTATDLNTDLVQWNAGSGIGPRTYFVYWFANVSQSIQNGCYPIDFNFVDNNDEECYVGINVSGSASGTNRGTRGIDVTQLYYRLN